MAILNLQNGSILTIMSKFIENSAKIKIVEHFELFDEN